MSTGENLQIQSPYLFQVRENKDQKKLEICSFSRSGMLEKHLWKNFIFLYMSWQESWHRKVFPVA